jgi:ARC6-like, IMS domain
MNSKPEIIKKLEDKIGAAISDCNLSALAGGNKQEQSAMLEYVKLVQDIDFPIGVRYLALYCVANKNDFYTEVRDQQEMLGTVSQEMGDLLPGEVVMGIQSLKVDYPAIYQLDSAAIDRYESHAVEFMTRLPGDLQERKVADGKNISLKPRPIETIPIPVIPPQATVSPVQEIKAPSIPSIPPTPAEAYRPQQSKFPPVTNNNSNNKGALIIGGGMVAGAIIFSAALISSKSNQTSTSIPNSTPQPSLAANTPDNISQDEAKKLVERWIQAKQRIFAPPYDQELGSQLTTGKAYTDKVRGPSSDGTPYSSLEWLRQYGYRYQYSVQNIEGFTRFESSSDRASIEIQILEDAKLYDKEGNLQPKRSGLERKTVRFILKKDNGILKISDYDVLGESKRKS